MSDIVDAAAKLAEGLVLAVNMMTETVNEMLLMLKSGGREIKGGLKSLSETIQEQYVKWKYDQNPTPYPGSLTVKEEFNRSDVPYHFYCEYNYDKDIKKHDQKNKDLTKAYNDLKTNIDDGFEKEGVSDIARGVKEKQLNEAIAQRDKYTKGWGTAWDKHNEKVIKLRGELNLADKKRSEGSESQRGETSVGSKFIYDLSLPANEMLVVLKRKIDSKNLEREKLVKLRDSHKALRELEEEDLDNKVKKNQDAIAELESVNATYFAKIQAINAKEKALEEGKSLSDQDVANKKYYEGLMASNNKRTEEAQKNINDFEDLIKENDEYKDSIRKSKKVELNEEEGGKEERGKGERERTDEPVTV